MLSTPVFEAIKTKRAVRLFKEEALADEEINTILEAGRLSGSAKNSQPWHFIVVRRREILQTLSQCGTGAGHLAGAAMAVALVVAAPFERESVPFDLGRTSQNMMLTAWSLGIGSVMATIYQADRAAEALELPAGMMVPWCISFGYPAEESPRPARKGMRRAAAEVVHWETW